MNTPVLLNENSIRPLPELQGVGFCSMCQLSPEGLTEFRYENVGRYHNYHVTAKAWNWPLSYSPPPALKIDAFSPNLNKELHVGHLRNLAVARAMSGILENRSVLGVKKAATQSLFGWFHFINYTPSIFYDVLMPDDVIETRSLTEAEVAIMKEKEPGYWKQIQQVGHLYNAIDPPRVWDGPNGPIIVVRGDGRKLYAYHDLVFAEEVGPTHYITGHEQSSHFASLGFKDKHLPLGLVLGVNGKKLSSREGTAISANDAMQMVIDKLDPKTENIKKVAWNVLAWNFLRVSRSQDLKFEPEIWTSPMCGGMYITYTYARIFSALQDTSIEPFSDTSVSHMDLWIKQGFKNCGWEGFYPFTHWRGLEKIDYQLLGFASQSVYWKYQSQTALDPAPFANYLFELAGKFTGFYENCPVQKADDAATRDSRLVLCALTARVLKLGLETLGIETVEQM